MHSYGLDMLGAESQGPDKPSASAVLIWLGGAAVGLAVGEGVWGGNLKRVVLSGLSGGVLANGARSLVKKEHTWGEVLRGVGAHAGGVAGALVSDSHPVMGYAAGRIGTRAVIDGRFRTKIERFLRPQETPHRVEIVDVTPQEQVRA